LLWQFLELNPEKRISAEMAMQHEFFDSIRQGSPISLSSKYDLEMNPIISSYKGDIPVEHFPYVAQMRHLNEMRLMPERNFMSTV
jgi:hypothetical protein